MATVKELKDSGTIRFTAKGRQGTRVFHVRPYSEAEQWAADQLGGITTSLEGGEPRRIPPKRYAPNSPMYATSADLKGIGKPQSTGGQGPDFAGGAIVTIQYETTDFDQQQSSDPESENMTFLTEEVSFSADILTLKPDDWKWSPSNEDLDTNDPAPGKLAPRADWRLTAHRVPQLNRKLIMDAIGKVNGVKVIDHDPETLLLLGAHARRQWDSQGFPTWEITFEIGHKKDGWNKFYRSKTAAWEELVLKTDATKKAYEKTDFFGVIPELKKAKKKKATA